MRICAYTSCSINYLPKARALARSLRNMHADAIIVLCLNDEAPPFIDLAAEPFTAVWHPRDLGFDRGWEFKHSIMEVCTAVKGRALVRLLRDFEADLYLYLDPDVVVYQPLDPMGDYMGNAEIGLVPHITKPETTEIGIRLTELSVVAHGTYNLGHLIIRKGESSLKFAQWWDDRLTDYCYDNKEYGLFTDQRWCDLVPALFDRVAILRQPNMDVASWNVYGRKFAHRDGQYVVDGYPLLTYHFSGTGPTGVHRVMRDIFAPADGVVAQIERDYEEAIASNGQALLERHPYAGDFYESGEKVTWEARKIYRDNIDLQNAFPDPYQAGEDSFLAWLKRNRPLHCKGITLPAHRLNKAFEELFDANYYFSRYPSAAEAVRRGDYLDAIDHYVCVGSRLGMDPSLLFVSQHYFPNAQKLGGFSLSGANSDRREDTLLWHYLTVGLPNGIEPVAYFDSNAYLEINPDIAQAFEQRLISTPLAHFMWNGDGEGRRPSKDWVASKFVEDVPEARALMAQGLGPFAAFVTLGNVPGRVGSISQ